jgi:hypothetical protein
MDGNCAGPATAGKLRWGRNGAVQDQGAISNDLHALEKLLARLRKRYGREVIIRACYEAGPCGFTIARRLKGPKGFIGGL